MDTNRLQEIGDEIINDLEGVNAAREGALPETRRIIRLSANSIRAAHRGEIDVADELTSEARERMATLVESLASQPSIYWAGYLRDAQKEMAEAHLTLAVLADREWPTPDELGVEGAAYLNALAETAGELRRHALDSMRRSELERAERVLSIMNEIHDLLVTVDFPDAVTGGLRRSTDLARGVTERTRGDLTIALRQRELSDSLARLEAKLGN